MRPSVGAGRYDARPALACPDEDFRLCPQPERRLVAPIGSAAGDVHLRDVDRDARYAAVHAIDRDGRRHSGGAAVPVVLDGLPYGRLPARVLRTWPRATDVGYRLLARHRRTLVRLVGAPQARSVSRR